MSRALSFLLTSFAVAVTSCSSSSSPNNSETHWLKCKVTSDCATGDACVAGQCMPASTGMDPAFANPTGNCVAPNDGSRPGYNAAGDLKWLPDCQAFLKREYWRVYAASASQAAIVPRPDGTPGLAAPCADKSHALAAIVEKYGLCQSATTEAQVTTINNMSYGDAFAIARYLQSQLVFFSAGDELSPPPIPSDILDACALHKDLNSAAFASICQREADRLMSGIDIGFSYNGPGAVELAARLNELYGIHVEPAEGGACAQRTERVLLDASFVSVGGTPAAWPAPGCVPTCATDKAQDFSPLIDALPAGSCEPGTSPCSMMAVRPCGCTGSGGPHDGYRCACVGGRWECIIASKAASICLPCDAGAADAALE
jgi:hypothetical protein